MIPWRFTITTDMPPDQVMDKLSDLTDQRMYSLWHWCAASGSNLDRHYRFTIFEGRLNLTDRSFNLRNYISDSARLETAYHGSVERNESGARIRVLVGATFLQKVFITLITIAMLGGAIRSYVTALHPNKAIFLLPVFMFLVAFAVFFFSQVGAKRLFERMFIDKEGLSKNDVWPEVGDLGAERGLSYPKRADQTRTHPVDGWISS